MKAILVSDVLNGFCRCGLLASPRLAAVVPRIRDYLGRELALGARAVFLVDAHRPDDPEFSMFPPHCITGSGEDEVVEELQEFVRRSTVVRKPTFSAFYRTELDAVLAGMGPGEVEVVGVCTDICVLFAVADLRIRGYEVTVPADLVATYDAPGHPGDEVERWALDHMRLVLGARIR